MTDIRQDRVLALAGVFQAARLVQQLSREGRAEKDSLYATINTIFKIDAQTTADVYGGVRGVSLGLALLRDKLSGATEPTDLELARYVISMMQLEVALKRRPEMADAIKRGIETIEEQMRFFEAVEDTSESVHPRQLEKLAELYTQTLSTLSPRIMVTGEHGHLANPVVAGRVRAVLLGGIRSAVLWRQLGGSRWQLLLARRRIASEAKRLLNGLSAGAAA